MSSSPIVSDYNLLFDRIFASRTSNDHILFLSIQGDVLSSTTDHSVSANLKDLNAKISQFITDFIKVDHSEPKAIQENRRLAQHFRTYAGLEFRRDKNHFPEATSKTIQYFLEVTREKKSNLNIKSSSTPFYGVTIKHTKLITFDEEGKKAASRKIKISHSLGYAEQHRLFDDEEEKEEYFLENLNKQMNSLTSIKNNQFIGIQDITNAFIKQVFLKMISVEKEIVHNPTYISFIVQKVLNDLSEKVESGKLEKVTTHRFIDDLVSDLYAYNGTLEEIDRTTFYFLTNKTKDRVSRPLAGIYPTLEKLQDEFDRGEWMEDETRLLVHLETNKYTLKCYCSVLEKFKTSRELKTILNHYFDSL